LADGKAGFSSGFSGFRNAPGKTFFKHLKNNGRKFIPETGMAYPKVRKLKLNRANSDPEKIG
jgi:hypothetical protein